jgi:hypothetical protein
MASGVLSSIDRSKVVRASAICRLGCIKLFRGTVQCLGAASEEAAIGEAGSINPFTGHGRVEGSLNPSPGTLGIRFAGKGKKILRLIAGSCASVDPL